MPDVVHFGLTKPCANCPFRKIGGVRFLGRERAEKIIGAEGTFSCHKTTGAEGRKPRTGEQCCAGFLLVRENMRRPNQFMRIMERLGVYDRSKLSGHGEVFADAAAFIEAQTLDGE